MTVVSLTALMAACSSRDHPIDPKSVADLLVQRTDVANGKEAVLEVDYLVKNLFVRKEVSVIYGPTNCGKSTLISAIGMAVVRGKPFAGFLTRRTAVLHIAPEGARSVQDATFLHIGAGAPSDAELYFIAPLRIDLRDHRHVATLIELVSALERDHGCDIGLIVIDTLVLSVDDADENASRDMTAAIFGATRLAEGSEAHVTMVHHTNKSGDVRGSSAITCNPDAVFEIAPAKDEQDRPVMQMTNQKQKSGKKAPQILFRLRAEPIGQHSDGDERTAVVIDVLPRGTKTAPTGKTSKGKSPTTDARREAVLAAMVTLSDDPAAADTGFEPAAVRDACNPSAFTGCADNPGSFLKAVSRALEALAGEANSVIVKEGGRYRLVNGPASAPAPSSELDLFSFGIAAE